MSGTGDLGYVGYQPAVSVQVDERYKYEQIWKLDAARPAPIGEMVAAEFMRMAKPSRGDTVTDFGCGTGQGALMLAILGDVKVQMVDFAANCLDEDLRNALTTQSHMLSFTQHDMKHRIPLNARYGFCVDVIEHVPAEHLDQVLGNILRSSEFVYFNIGTIADEDRESAGYPLYLSLHSDAFWREKFKAFECRILAYEDHGKRCSFYVTAWQAALDVAKTGIVNTVKDQLRENVRLNIAGPWINVQPHDANDVEVMLLGGGPSLNDFEDEIRQHRENGVKLVTTNGSYHWALDHGFTPSAQVVVDARPFNARFTKPVVADCKYMIASQVDPSVFEGLPPERTYIWHANADDVKDLLDERYSRWWPTNGGPTVILRSIVLFRQLGFRRFHLYGVDSCLMDGKHHAYAQPENDEEEVIPVTCGDRVFQCRAWQLAQAAEFMETIKQFGDHIELSVNGDGLLAYILKTGAKLETQEPTV